ncbi:eukaryotic translation initiation factor 4 gamma-like [Lathyrus oleraceus]|uniref:eukaryotic translation initiation factor 4 gamma-like n=1 Tax=Pisum sativum TaxID=3888 RepID=UPI0021CF8DFC|nr:eukaryotic translation initiation factor 4 gamma-like [Pisum sativum]
MTSEVFKLKSLSEQVKNGYIREAKERLEARMAREAEEKAKEKARLEAKEKSRKEVEEKATARAAAAEAEAKAKADAEEASHIDAEESSTTKEVALTQGESSNSDISPLVLKTLEELQKEQQIVRARLDQQDFVNSNIQSLLTQLLQRMSPPPNP